MNIRFWIALWAGKLITLVLKTLGKNGTTFPGLVAHRICPDLIGILASSYAEGTVIITGTNGKTTTNNLLASILRSAGITAAYNKEGANMLTGITGTLLQNTSFRGETTAAVLLLEVDEATVPGLCKQLTPRLAIVTNFFRDQLDRYGELDTTVRLVKEALPPSTKLVLNADDPLVAQIGTGRTGVYYYGASRLPSSKEVSTETREGRYCSHCGQELGYKLFHYGQLGIYECPVCGFSRPEPYIEAAEIRQEDDGITFWVKGEVEGEFHVPLQGYYNLYNALAALAAADRLHVAGEEIRAGLMTFVADAGRMEKFVLPGGSLTLTLVKNPIGFNQVIRTLAGRDKPLRLLIAINDLAADGRDISWLWDVDFEILAAEADSIAQVICTGLRAEDMALRLKYAGFPVERLRIEHALDKAVDLADNRSARDEAVYILPTYTALFPMRKILVSRGIDIGKAKGVRA